MKNTPRRQNQKGATMIILALIIATLMAITIIGISQLTVSKKKNSKSLDASETAYQKADEAAECALWGRKAALENGSNSADLTYKMFAKHITEHYCSQYNAPVPLIKLYKELAPSFTLTPNCASPLWAANIFTEGSQEIANNFSDNSTKKRGVGATVNVAASTLIKPFVACNKLAEFGAIKTVPDVRNSSGCTGPTDLPDADSATGYGWLTNWPECYSVCVSDPNHCAYYDTNLDGVESSLYPDNRREGARWCWTKNLDIDATDPGTMCSCLGANTVAGSEKYWDHPDVIAKEFCHPCRRIYDPDAGGGWNSNACGGVGKAGDICLDAYNVPFNAAVWGSPGKPTSSDDAGILTSGDCYSCYCRDFWLDNENWCTSYCSNNGSQSTNP